MVYKFILKNINVLWGFFFIDDVDDTQMQRGEGDGGGQQRPTAQFPLRALRQINVSVSPLKL